MVCGTCGCNNAEHLVFCRECGQRLGPRVAPPTPAIGAGPATTRAAAPCPRCGGANQAGVRYCITCGEVLSASAAPPANTVEARPTSETPAPPAAQAPPNGKPVDAGPPGSRVCTRCRGTSDDSAQFCRFCGAALEGARGPASADPHAAAFWRPAAPVVFAKGPEARVTAAPPRAPLAYGRVVVITKDGAEGASYPLVDQLDIGRSEGDVVIREDAYLSPRHARVVRRPETAAFALVDLASTNGVFLRLGSSEAPILDQDLFLVGQQVLKFDRVRDGEEGLAPATQHGTLVFGTPVAARHARLSQRTVEGVVRDVYHLMKAETILGRESGDIVFTEDPFLSRRHASIRRAADGASYVLSDLGSSNGTFIQIRGEVAIKSGDQFRIGQQLFRVDLSAAPAP